jgi:hypothetical protein
MSEQTETTMQAEALLRLAGLEKDCNCACHGGSAPVLNKRQCAEDSCDFCCGEPDKPGKVPVLDLRKPCRCEGGRGRIIAITRLARYVQSRCTESWRLERDFVQSRRCQDP